jgi:hypothetical protein
MCLAERHGSQPTGQRAGDTAYRVGVPENFQGHLQAFEVIDGQQHSFSLAVAEHDQFVALFGADLIVVPSREVPAKIEEFNRHLAERAGSGAPTADPPLLGMPDEILAVETVAVHFIAEEGLTLYPRLPPDRGSVWQPSADLPPSISPFPLRLPARSRHLSGAAQAARSP